MRVLNKHRDIIPHDAVYIGRGSKWGNPFVIGRDGTREEVIEKYRNYIIHSDIVLEVNELIGRDIWCYCTPKACHGDVLLEIIEILYGKNTLY